MNGGVPPLSLYMVMSWRGTDLYFFINLIWFKLIMYIAYNFTVRENFVAKSDQ